MRAVCCVETSTVFTIPAMEHGNALSNSTMRTVMPGGEDHDQ